MNGKTVQLFIVVAIYWELIIIDEFVYDSLGKCVYLAKTTYGVSYNL